MSPLVVVLDSLEQPADTLLPHLIKEESAHGVVVVSVSVNGVGALPATTQLDAITVQGSSSILPNATSIPLDDLVDTLKGVVQRDPNTLVVLRALHLIVWHNVMVWRALLRWMRDTLPTTTRMVVQMKRDFPFQHASHEPSPLAVLEAMATTCITLHANQSCKVMQVKGGGRVTHQTYIWQESTMDLVPASTSTSTSTATQDVPVSSFNLQLTPEQRQQKDELVLPYTAAQSTTTATFYYDPDSADDFDEEDPDDDLLL